MLHSSVSSFGVTLLLYPLEKTHTPQKHRHTRCSSLLRVFWSQDTFCSVQCGGLMRSTVSLRHVHKHPPTHTLTYRSLGAHTQREIQQVLRITRLLLDRPNVYCSFKLVLCVRQEYKSLCASFVCCGAQCRSRIKAWLCSDFSCYCGKPQSWPHRMSQQGWRSNGSGRDTQWSRIIPPRIIVLNSVHVSVCVHTDCHIVCEGDG